MGLSCGLPVPLFAAPVCTPPYLRVAITLGNCHWGWRFSCCVVPVFRDMAAQGWKPVPAREPAAPRNALWLLDPGGLQGAGHIHEPFVQTPSGHFVRCH